MKRTGRIINVRAAGSWQFLAMAIVALAGGGGLARAGLSIDLQGGSPLSGAISGAVDFNTSGMNLVRSGTQDRSTDDLQSEFIHELEEELGIAGAGSPLAMSGLTTDAGGPVDLSRYSANGTRGYFEMAGPNPHFSIDGGATSLIDFNEEGAADGADVAEWSDGITGAEQGNTPPTIQAASGTSEAQPNSDPKKKTAFAAAGLNVSFHGVVVEGVPEPGSALIFASGAAMLLGARRRRNG